MDRNPYSPPASDVSETRVPIPVQVKTALSLFGLSLLLSVPHVLYRFMGLSSEPWRHDAEIYSALLGLVVLLGLAGVLIAANWRGWRWGRILFVVVVVLGTYNAFTAVPTWFRRSTFLGSTDLLSVVADVAALALLFTPAANAFFRHR